jgi:hypothetical protein
MKNKIYRALSVLMLVLAFTFNSCSEEESELRNDNLIQKSEDDCKVDKVEVKFVGQLHRGERWSERNNVTPCTQSFGLCNLKFKEVTVTVKCPSIAKNNSSYYNNPEQVYNEETTHMAFEPTSNPPIIRLSFLEEPKDYQSGIFISHYDDDDVKISSEISEHLGYSNNFLINAKDYSFETSEEYSYGYVDLTVYED